MLSFAGDEPWLVGVRRHGLGVDARVGETVHDLGAVPRGASCAMPQCGPARGRRGPQGHDTTLAQNAVVLAQKVDLISQVAKPNERVAELLPVAERNVRKAKPTPPSEAAQPALTDEQRRAFENRPRPPT